MRFCWMLCLLALLAPATVLAQSGSNLNTAVDKYFTVNATTPPELIARNGDFAASARELQREMVDQYGYNPAATPGTISTTLSGVVIIWSGDGVAVTSNQSDAILIVTGEPGSPGVSVSGTFGASASASSVYAVAGNGSGAAGGTATAANNSTVFNGGLAVAYGGNSTGGANSGGATASGTSARVYARSGDAAGAGTAVGVTVTGVLSGEVVVGDSENGNTGVASISATDDAIARAGNALGAGTVGLATATSTGSGNAYAYGGSTPGGNAAGTATAVAASGDAFAYGGESFFTGPGGAANATSTTGNSVAIAGSSTDGTGGAATATNLGGSGDAYAQGGEGLNTGGTADATTVGGTATAQGGDADPNVGGSLGGVATANMPGQTEIETPTNPNGGFAQVP